MLQFKDISHRYGQQAALEGVTLTAYAGEILCLLGPSGCGKTTLLNLTAGILPLQSGTLTLDGEILASVKNSPPPEARPVGLVFQEGALFPHMRVADNIAFGIMKDPNHAARVADLLEQVGLPGYEDRYPHTLSGGQQQRIAVARALAPKPPILLMDEPFANIDIAMRRRLREDIRLILRARNTITIIVTHDPEEAMEIGDKIAIMDQGRIIQAGRPVDIYNAPKSLAVARMTSDGACVKAQISGGKLITQWGEWPLNCLADTQLRAQGKSKPGKLNLYLRPLSVGLELVKSGEDGFEIIDVRQSGSVQTVVLGSGKNQTLRLHTAPRPSWEIGQKVSLHPKAKTVIAFAD